MKKQNSKHQIPNTTQNKGITLVALIITIIILLILSVVAIQSVNGDGIIQRAKDAADGYTIAQEKEAVYLAAHHAFLIGNGKIDPNNLKIGMNAQFGEMGSDTWNYADNTTNPDEWVIVKILPDGREYKIYMNGKVEGPLTNGGGNGVISVTNTYGTNWTYAWTCTNGSWNPMIDNSDETKTEADLGTYDVVAKFYKQNQTLNGEDMPELLLHPDTELMAPKTMANGNAYKLVIEGNGAMGNIMNGETLTGYAWTENAIIGAMSKVTLTEEDFLMPYVTEVLICDGVTSIGDYGLFGAISLKDSDDIKISRTVETIGEYAFQLNNSLESIVLPEGVKEIKHQAFAYTNIKVITLPTTLETIETEAFTDCTSLETLKILGKVTTMGERVFDNCSILRDVQIGEKVTTIGDSAFDGCDALEELHIPASVTNIGNQPFYKVKRIYIHKSAKDIKDMEGYNWEIMEDSTIYDKDGNAVN